MGTEHEFVRVLAGRRVASRNRFIAYDAGRYVAYETPAGWATGTVSYLAEPSASGRTALTTRIELRVHGIARPLEPILGRLLALSARRSEKRLEDLLESGGALAAT